MSEQPQTAPVPAPRPQIAAGRAPQGGLIPTDMEQMWRMATAFSASGLMPKGLTSPEAVFTAIQMGLEVGLSPMQAVQNIAVINGRPSLWGDAALGLVEASGLLEDFQEFNEGGNKAVCIAKRRGRTACRREFSMDDAKQAGLTAKDGPWKQYPKRMLQMRARSWALRDNFADVLKGLRVAEEQLDVVDLSEFGGGYAMQPEVVAEVPDLRPGLYEQLFGLALAKGLTADADQEDLARYIKALANHYKKDEAEVLEGAVAKFEDSFWYSYIKWPSCTFKPAPAEKPVRTRKAAPADQPEPANQQQMDAIRTRLEHLKAPERYQRDMEDIMAALPANLTFAEAKALIEDLVAEPPVWDRVDKIVTAAASQAPGPTR